MRQHEREPMVREVQARVLEAIDREMAGLTLWEALRVVNAVCSDWIAGAAKTAIRMERHGNTETPGGFAPEKESEDGR